MTVGSVMQIKRLRERDAFLARITELELDDILTPAQNDGIATAFTISKPITSRRFANRFCVLPMEGWDGTSDGRPTDLVRRRWQRFGASGASMIWGGEAVAVVPQGRANPHQLTIGPHSIDDLTSLRLAAVRAHAEATGSAPAPFVGLQLTHSGRWCKPTDRFEPQTAYRHPILDERVQATDENLLTDSQLDDLIQRFVHAATVARDAGFDFVDIKHCHGYLLHELLSAHDRPGPYGGSFENRTRFLREVLAGIARDASGIATAVRLSVYDLAPHVAGPDGIGIVHPEVRDHYPYAFGGDGSGIGVDLTETHQFCEAINHLGVQWLSVTAGSPYYCPHAQRPAYFPPSDGYLPPNDPLIDVANMLRATRAIAAAHPSLAVVASGMSYLQEWLAAVGAQLLDDGAAAFIGVGRSALSYPELPLHTSIGAPIQREQLCRTFSDCTTAPRNGLVSGCYPIDPLYKAMPERVALTQAKRAAEAARGGRRRS